MRLAKHVASDAHDVGLVGAAPQKEGQLMLMMLAMFWSFEKTPGHVVRVWKDAGLVMLMMLAMLCAFGKTRVFDCS